MSLDKPFGNDESGEMMIDIKSGNMDPEESVIKKQKIILMREVVEKLKPRYRELVELRYFKEYSYEEIAEQLDLPIGTVKAQLFRAREFLFNILKNTEDKL
jgi:RNA polymerase sigma-70 factor (ECF subfamily)